jgi:YgiT-type zinc finger domain-containing protein
MEPEQRDRKQAGEDTSGPQVVHRCEHCGSRTHDKVVKAAFWGDRGLVAIEDIPARVCEACGEQFYDEATARKIEKLVADPATGMKRQILVPVFSLAEVAGP